ncbi:hypothetical protein E2562_012120 [Oryza meyeriana var. granulata]|uniref:Uncharacterized protein n=1 Tax=Oryza meyeriana var. granulata TaxID=110450 RepID=A0A6G1F7E0_9ORYZ|nr:hypothetical protein E2562_012120 [Oryza meyeriana var. granulata]
MWQRPCPQHGARRCPLGGRDEVPRGEAWESVAVADGGGVIGLDLATVAQTMRMMKMTSSSTKAEKHGVSAHRSSGLCTPPPLFREACAGEGFLLGITAREDLNGEGEVMASGGALIREDSVAF